MKKLSKKRFAEIDNAMPSGAMVNLAQCITKIETAAVIFSDLKITREEVKSYLMQVISELYTEN